MTVRNKQNHLKYKNVITLKLTDIELNIVNHAATMAGLSRSEYIRQLILNGTVPVHGYADCFPLHPDGAVLS